MTNIHVGGYSVVVGNVAGSVTSASATLALLVKPFFLLQPESQTALVGDTVSFNVLAGGTLPIGYRWRHGFTNFVPLGGPTLTLNNVQLSDAGSYTVILTNAALVTPGVVSAAAVLTVLLDSDGDRLPDVWETLYSLNPNDPSDAALDSDMDGFTNVQEYIAGTNPRDAASFLKVERISSVLARALIEFNAVSNKTYSVLFQNALPNGAWLKLTDVNAAPTNRLVSVTDTNPGPERIYRLATPRQP